MDLIFALILIVVAFLLGSLSSAVVVSRMLGLPDPRTAGSNNPGATNVLRLGGKKAAGLTLAGDMLKGLLPTAVASIVGVAEPVIALVGLAAVVGHIFPVFFEFKGGKGVATGLGALLGTHWVTGLLVIAIWLATCLVFRISSLAALIAFSAAPILFLVSGMKWSALVYLVIAALLFWRHRANLSRLLKGTEPRLGSTQQSGSTQ